MQSSSLSIFSLVAHASFVVQCVLTLLVCLSLASWTTIFQKAIQLHRVRTQTIDFERRFWSGADLADLLAAARGAGTRATPEEKIFEAGMGEYIKLSGSKAETDSVLGGVRRAMKAAYQRELERLERGLNMLASIGSVSPYIGLFGTVWGIMNAFTGLATLDNVSLATVAPGIAEALVATAIGLFAAIPAVVAYNRFANDLDRIATGFESYMEEFQNILQRQHR